MSDFPRHAALTTILTLCLAARAASAEDAAPRVEEPRLHARMRAGAGIATAAPAVGVMATTTVRAAKEESRVSVGAAVRQVVPTPRAASRSPLDLALERTRDAVLAHDPRAIGKISIAFTVGAHGRLRDVMVIGFDDALDQSLEAALRREVFPGAHAGQRINTTLTFRGGKAAVR